MENKITIVGPMNESHDNEKRRVKNNLTAFFLMAKYNDSFREKVLANKDKAIVEAGFGLSKSEKFILDRYDNNKLIKYLKSFKISEITKKSLPDWKSVAAIILLLSSLTVATSSCKSQQTRGHRIDIAMNDKKIEKSNIEKDKKI